MRHLNFSRLQFTESVVKRYGKGGFYGQVPPHSFYKSYEYFGHNVGEYFVVEIPHSISPIPDETDSVTLVLPPNSFNVTIPFKITSAFYDQDGALIFGDVGGGIRSILAGGNHILYSNAIGNNSMDFVAVLREGDHIAIRTQGWQNISRRTGKIDIVYIFTDTGEEIVDYKGYFNYLEQLEARKKLDDGDWRLA